MSTNMKNKTATKPNRSTMEGMVLNANAVLDAALDPEHSGVPPQLIEKCKGVVLVSIRSAGLVVAGQVGSGVIIAKRGEGWSPPAAVGVLGYSLGAVVGAEVQDAMIFIMDEETLEDFCTHEQTRLGAQASFAVGKLGRDVDFGIEAPNSGTVTVNFYKGFYADISLEVATLGHRKTANRKFYGQAVSAKKILFDQNLRIPDKESGIPDLQKKLALLATGKTNKLSAVDLDKSERLRKEAVALESKDVENETMDLSNQGSVRA